MGILDAGIFAMDAAILLDGGRDVGILLEEHVMGASKIGYSRPLYLRRMLDAGKWFPKKFGGTNILQTIVSLDKF